MEVGILFFLHVFLGFCSNRALRPLQTEKEPRFRLKTRFFDRLKGAVAKYSPEKKFEEALALKREPAKISSQGFFFLVKLFYEATNYRNRLSHNKPGCATKI